ncbi:thiamine ABC transporter substrate-binding protein [soil metagenome]
MTSRRALRTIGSIRSVSTAALASALVLAVSSCSLIGSGEDDVAAEQKVVLLTHSDFSLPDEVIAGFEKESGYTLDIRPTDGVGNLVNLVADQAGKPSGDVVFGVDNTFASRVLDAGAIAPYGADLPAGAAAYALPGDGAGDGADDGADDGAGDLVPIDSGNVCVNIDDTWFAKRKIDPPQTLDDLTDPTYKNLFVTPSATGSSPGLAFLLTTVAAYGDAWPDYWQKLLDNGAKIAKGWSEGYYGDFTGGGGDGDRPIVLSYDSSPAFTIADDGTSTTSALLDTCFQQVEYAGVLAGTDNEAGATALVDYLLGPAVQGALPESMYVFPVLDGTALPADWAAHAERPTDPYSLDPAEIGANREDWLLEWNDLITR